MTHFVINIDNGQTLGFRGDSAIKYVEMVSNGDSMTMVVKIFGGRWAMIVASLLIFTNTNNNYPIQNLENNIPGVC